VGRAEEQFKLVTLPAWGRKEKIPPPSLLISTIVAFWPWSLAASRPLASW
jgi:hypothetical protein